mmetsp:Transcript_34976/g.48866  ORF Transcript_34976/g.48866 Transcript_34976/m.48866 type:complete len:302 (+) Transcript_34976:140-1045(+)
MAPATCDMLRRALQQVVAVKVGVLLACFLCIFVLGRWSTSTKVEKSALHQRSRIDVRGSPISKIAAQPSTESSCQKQLREIFEQGLWKDVDLSSYNELAAKMDEIMPEIQEGHSGQLVAERKAYILMASLPCVRRICEIGFNGGHSAALWLKAAPKAEVVMFDLWNHTYNARGEAFLRDPRSTREFQLPNANERLHIIKGSSLKTVPSFARDFPEKKCDLISIDGGHTEDIARADLWSMANLANRNFHVLLLDDTNCEGFWCNGPQAALEHHMGTGLVKIIAGITEENAGRGLSILQYIKH